jgi:methyl-accepting chemotaxis protein
VATEVKDLARQSTEATEDIRKKIEGMQRSTGEAVEVIGQISQVIQQVNGVSRTIAAAVEEQSVATKEIAKNLAEAATSVTTVSRNVAESAGVGKEIARNILGVDEAAKQPAEGAVRTQTASERMLQMADELQSLIVQFTV